MGQFRQRRHYYDHIRRFAGSRVRAHLSDSASYRNADARFRRESCGIDHSANFLECFLPAPWQVQFDGACRALHPNEMACKEKRFMAMRPECLIHTVAKEKSMIQYGDPGLFSGSNVSIHADYTGHASTRLEIARSARSLSIRCLSALAVRRGKSIGGRSPKWMFMGAKCFVGVET